MEALLLLGRLLLAAVFLVAGATKLLDGGGTRDSLRAFGVPAAAVAPLGVALPVAELAVAAVLLPSTTSRWGAVLAVLLLALFTTAIAVNLARGRRPACRCFGQLGAGPVGRTTLLRNSVLLLLGVLVLAGESAYPGTSLLASTPESTPLVVMLAVAASVLAAVVVIGGALVVQLLSQQARLLVRVEQLEHRLAMVDGGASHLGLGSHDQTPPVDEGLEVGTTAPAFSLTGLGGDNRSLDDLLQAGQPLLLIFTDPACSPCTALLPEIGEWQRVLGDRVTLAVIGRGTVEANRARAVEHGVERVLLQQRDEVADAYRVFGTPAAVLVRADRTIGSPVAGGPEAIRSLVTHTATHLDGPVWSPLLLLPMVDEVIRRVSDPRELGTPKDAAEGIAAVEPLPLGSLLPALTLPSVDGGHVQTADLAGQPTVLVFWNPGCTFCHQLRPALLDWERGQEPGSPRLVVISEGSVEENRGLGFQGPILLDKTLAFGARLGVRGTPSALIVDEEGRIASSLAVGGTAILGLLGSAGTAEHTNVRRHV